MDKIIIAIGFYGSLFLYGIILDVLTDIRNELRKIREGENEQTR